MNDDPPPPPPTLQSMFVAFAKFGATERTFDGSSILLSQSDVWLQQAKIFNKYLTLTDTGVVYNTFKQLKLDYPTFCLFLEKLCIEKQLDLADLKLKLINCGMPGAASKNLGN